MATRTRSKASRMLSRSAWDCPHVQSVKAWALVLTPRTINGEPQEDRSDLGRMAGRIVANYSDNPNGAVCTVTLHFFAGPLAIMPTTTGTAGGGGYDKFSAAVADALDRAYGLDADAHDHPGRFGTFPNGLPYFHDDQKEAWKALQARKLDALSHKEGGWATMHGTGESAVRAFLEAHGYTALEVI